MLRLLLQWLFYLHFVGVDILFSHLLTWMTWPLNDRMLNLKSVQADDADGTSANNQVTYSLAPSPWTANFSMSSQTGTLTLKSSLDYEALSAGSGGEITVRVLATDSGSPTRTGSVNITITVQVGGIESLMWL
jgi:hypothetical protein